MTSPESSVLEMSMKEMEALYSLDDRNTLSSQVSTPIRKINCSIPLRKGEANSPETQEVCHVMRRIVLYQRSLVVSAAIFMISDVAVQPLSPQHPSKQATSCTEVEA